MYIKVLQEVIVKMFYGILDSDSPIYASVHISHLWSVYGLCLYMVSYTSVVCVWFMPLYGILHMGMFIKVVF